MNHPCLSTMQTLAYHTRKHDISACCRIATTVHSLNTLFLVFYSWYSIPRVFRKYLYKMHTRNKYMGRRP